MRGWRGDSEAHAAAGRKGGKLTLENKGKDFYRGIGKLGGPVSGGNFKNNREGAVAAGIKSGEVRRQKRALLEKAKNENIN